MPSYQRTVAGINLGDIFEATVLVEWDVHPEDPGDHLTPPSPLCVQITNAVVLSVTGDNWFCDRDYIKPDNLLAELDKAAFSIIQDDVDDQGWILHELEKSA